MAPGYERGFAFLRGVAIDQHLLTRKREKDLVGVIEAHPSLLGIGLDERTAVIVKGDRFEVVGPSKVAIYEPGKPYYFLSAGDRFDLKTRTRVD
jgi:cyanophycinase